ncbi:2OG-Fe(II) oxygenase family protein [Streptosporangium sp. NPDC004631]
MIDPLDNRANENLLSNGYSSVSLPAGASMVLQSALARSREFFGLPMEAKRRHSSHDLNFGYRPIGIEYSISPDRPDLNECFTLWNDRVDLVPGAESLTALMDSLLAWRGLLVPFVTDVITHLAGTFGDMEPSTFAAASYLQVNFYPESSSARDLLQDRHEDGHLLTVIHTTAPGLEIWLDQDEPLPVSTGENEVLIMAGSVLTALSGGKVAPLDHQVRNHRLANRIAIMYFVNPDLAAPLRPWTGEQDIDLRDLVRNNPSVFGLPNVPLL